MKLVCDPEPEYESIICDNTINFYVQIAPADLPGCYSKCAVLPSVRCVDGSEFKYPTNTGTERGCIAASRSGYLLRRITTEFRSVVL
jgi:hypothetical protein